MRTFLLPIIITAVMLTTTMQAIACQEHDQTVSIAPYLDSDGATSEYKEPSNAAQLCENACGGSSCRIDGRLVSQTDGRSLTCQCRGEKATP